MQDYSPSFYSFWHSSLLLIELTSAPDDRSIGIDYCQKISENKTHMDTAYEKYRRYLHQYLKSIANTIGSNTNTAILTTLTFSTVNHLRPSLRHSRFNRDILAEKNQPENVAHYNHTCQKTKKSQNWAQHQFSNGT